MAAEAATDTTREERNSRMDMRLAQSEKSLFERAAAAQGMHLTQWATAHLVEDARQDIEDVATTKLALDAFDAFAAALEQSMPAATRELLSEKPIWA